MNGAPRDTLKCKSSYFQTIQFSLIKQFNSIWTIDRTLSGATTSSRSKPGRDDNEGYSEFPKAPAFLEPDHQIGWYHIQDTHWVGESYPSANMQSMYSAVQADWAREILEFCEYVDGFMEHRITKNWSKISCSINLKRFSTTLLPSQVGL